jgi:glycyl-tRNA synthetase beta chain
VYDKVERMEKLADYLADHLAPQFVTPAKAGGQGSAIQTAESFRDRCIRAARLAKADLSTGMVGEFPELQGVMGRYYALNDGEGPRVADAIADHYKPLGPNDTCPSAPESISLALADKIDSLVAFFSAGEKPTGSGDPYALRRAAQGVIRIILENGLRLQLKPALNEAVRWLTPEAPNVTKELLDFIAERLKVHLRGEGFGFVGGVRLRGLRHDLIAAVFALEEDDLVRLLARGAELAAFVAVEDGTNLLTAYRRASNIVAIEERRDSQKYDGAADLSLLRQSEEQALAADLERVGAEIAPLLKAEEFGIAMSQLATMRRSVDEFFDKVTVNVDDKQLRENRLRLLARIRATMNQIADFSQIEG